MDKYIVEYRVSRRGFVSGKSKDGREWKKTAYRGAVVDGFGHVFDCDAESAFNATETYIPKDGDTVALVVSELSFRDVFPLVSFSDVLPPSELKQRGVTK